MQISMDPEHYDALQIRVLEEIIRSIHARLKGAGIPDENV